MPLRYGDLPTMLVDMTREDSLESLGNILRHLREASGTSLSDAAAMLDTTKGHLSNVERGRDLPSWRIVAFYEDQFHGDGIAWSGYVEVRTNPQQRQRVDTSSRPSYPLDGDASAFVADVTVPDGLVVPPNFEFVKTWRIKNSGTVKWDGRWLARDGAPTGYGLPHSPWRVAIPTTEPGDEVEISVPIRAHPIPGTAQIRWKMVDDDGWKYFPSKYPAGLVLTIIVREDEPPPNTVSDR